MALGTYKDVYTVADYEVRVNNIADSIIELNGNNFFSPFKDRIEKQIETMRDKERKIFTLLHVNSLEELNKNLDEYKKSVLNLSGEDLNKTFLEGLRWENEKEYFAFERDVTDCIDKIVREQGANSIEDLGVENARVAVLNFLNTGMKSNSFRFSSPYGMTKIKFNVAQFTQEQKARWKVLLAEKGYSGWEKDERGKGKYNIEIDANGESIRNSFTWKDLTEGLTQKEAASIKPDTRIDEINEKIRALIISKTSDPILINKIITHILSKNRFAFFVGKNLNDITGILGEIQGLYYLSKFLGGNLPAALQWRGGTYSGKEGKKPHQDILLEDLGIQVKNTSKEEFFGEDINFANANINTILDQAGVFAPEARNLFLNFYGTLGFNVEYHRDRRKQSGAQYLPGIRMTDKGAEHFVRLHSQLQSYESAIEGLLSIFAATLMYMDFYKNSSNIDANTLYLLGGTAFQTAANILSTILKEIEEQERSFRIKASFKQDKNIISALNAGKRGQQYSSLVMNDIVLTSSFRF